MLRRAINLYTLFIFIIGLLIVGIYSINSKYSVYASDLKSTKKKVLCSSRGYIYDRNLNPLVNEELFNKEYQITDKKSINEIAVNRYKNNQLCSHLIGYTNGEGKGISGIEKSYNDILSYYSGDMSVSYSASGMNRIIGEIGKTEYNNYLSNGGVVLTIDRDIQFVTEKCVDDGNLGKGAAVVMEVKTGEIVALCSRPNINPNRISEYLNDTDSPLINRALSEYSVGSVFKPVIAAICLENSINPNKEYNCTGYIKIGDTVFPCHKKDGHGKVDIFSATANSCNTYYINLTKELSGKSLISGARNFGFCKRIEIADGIYTACGRLPSEKLSSGEKANFSFGQGILTATPVHLAAAYAVFANKGIYKEPIIIKSVVDENKTAFKAVMPQPSRRIISEKTADTVLKALRETVINGSGKNAEPKNTDAVGKTATAQSGWYENEREINHTWFVGMFPANNPKYVVVILKEDGTGGSVDCAPIFKNIAQLIISYE